MPPNVKTANETAVDFLLQQGLAERFPESRSLEHWWETCREQASRWSDTMDQALVGGFVSDRPAYAFAAGYHCAVFRLVPDFPRDRFPAFCVTESRGVHPRAMDTRLTPVRQDPRSEGHWRLNGRKTFVTGADRADVLLVAASTGADESGRPRIKMVRVDRENPGVDIRLLDPLPFIPEIRHGEVFFKEVLLARDRILKGDGWADYVKPFRAMEDLHVAAAICGFLMRTAFQNRWPGDAVEMAAAQSLLLKSVAARRSVAREVHLLLAGALSFMTHLVESVAPLWEPCDPVIRARWARDRSLLDIAGAARQRRREAAWQSYRSDPKAGGTKESLTK
jgi:acyl-CoA dehydrogenase